MNDNGVQCVTFIEMGAPNAEDKATIRFPKRSHGTLATTPIIDYAIVMRPSEGRDPLRQRRTFGNWSTFGKDVMKLAGHNGHV